jgi:MerR family transcriptional regulator, copper efflux regulator
LTLHRRVEATLTEPGADTGTTMHIGELASRTGMSHPTLRHYDQIGLLTPTGRTEGGFRLYTEADLARLLIIRRMKPLGYALEEMGRLLEVVDALERAAETGEDTTELRAQIDGFIVDAQARRARLVRHLDMADEFLSRLEALPNGSGAADEA